MKKTVDISEPYSSRATAPEASTDLMPVKLAAAATAYKAAVAARALAAVRLAAIRQQCAEAERVVADHDQEINELKQALAKAALE